MYISFGGPIFLIAVGAILRYATNFDIQDVEMDTVGLILIIAGAAGLVLSFFQDAIWSKRREAVVERPVERERVVERPPPDDRRY